MKGAIRPVVVAHCDWSKDPKKRWMAVATFYNGRWRLKCPELVGDTSDLFERLQMRAFSPGPLLAGFDFPIGLPVDYGRKTGLSNFREALRTFGNGDWRDWFTVCERSDQISIHRPFYPMRPGGTSRLDLLSGLSLTSGQVLRRCEKGTPDRSPACSMFWTLGGNQVGKGAIAGWLEVVRPNINHLKLWPFDGTLEEVAQSASLIITETYPAEVYHQLGLSRHGWSKRKHAGRQQAAPLIEARIVQRDYTLDRDFRDLIKDGFAASSAGEDQFDALVGLLGMLDVVEGYKHEGFPQEVEITEWEGWIFGQNSF